MKGAAIVTFRISEQAGEADVKAFNEWYVNYIPRELGRVDEFESATRFVTGTDSCMYCTVYVISDVNKIKDAYHHNYSPEAKEDLEVWNSWLEKGVIYDVTWDFFKPEFSIGWDYFR